jgi:hypothetical protein
MKNWYCFLPNDTYKGIHMTEERHQESSERQVHSNHSQNEQPAHLTQYEGFEGMNYEQRRQPFKPGAHHEPSGNTLHENGQIKP